MRKLFGLLMAILILILIATPCFGAVLFSDNFDSQADWTILQSTSADTHCWLEENPTCANPSVQPPTNWYGWYNGFSHCAEGVTGEPGNNNMYINTIPGYPVAGTGTCYGGSGKCFTFWDESCSNPTGVMQDSDGNIGYNLSTSRAEIYVRWRVKFATGFSWLPNNGVVPQKKIMHIQYTSGGGSPWAYGDENPQNRPYSIPGFKVYSNNVWYYVGYRCEESWNCTGTPSITMDVAGDQDHINLGSWASVFGDNNWHTIELYYKMNSAVGVADGVHTFWLDGVQKYTRTNIPWADQGGDASPMRGWRVVSLGGNNNNAYDLVSETMASREQWFAIDDLCISDTYVGESVCGGSTPTSDQGCTISGGIFK